MTAAFCALLGLFVGFALAIAPKSVVNVQQDDESGRLLVRYEGKLYWLHRVVGEKE